MLEKRKEENKKEKEKKKPPKTLPSNRSDRLDGALATLPTTPVRISTHYPLPTTHYPLPTTCSCTIRLPTTQWTEGEEIRREIGG